MKGLKPKLSILFFLIAITVGIGQKKKSGQIILPNVVVVDYPVIEWINYQADTTVVGLNIQALTSRINSRLQLQRIEILVNGISTDVYTSSDFSDAIDRNNYHQVIDRTLTLRTGFNTIQIIAENIKGIRKESLRRVVVDPNQISLMRNKKDQTPPMIYVSNPSNIKNDHVVIYEDIIKITGTVIDESGIQQVSINNTIIPVKANGEFTIHLPLNVGETGITLEAKDINQNITLKRFTIERKNMDGSVYDPAVAKNYLLIIGINNYLSRSWPVLNNAVADAKAVREVLTTRSNFDSLNVTMLLDDQATRSNIYSALRKYIEKISSRDNLLIYYSGHGYFDKLMSEGYWVPVDATGKDISEFLPNSQILKIIENVNSQHTLLVADACFSGSLFASNTRGYTDQVEKYKSRWGLASGRLEVVSDGSVGANSPFAQSFIGFLQKNEEPKVAVSDLVQYVKKKVAETNDQTPTGNPLKGVGDEGGEFVFYKRQQ